jgi:DUF971 family protein
MSALLDKKESFFSQKGEQFEGIVVWDQKGLVVLWPDGHCGRFSWLALRQTCPCRECQAQFLSSYSVPEQETITRQEAETPVRTTLPHYALGGVL